MDFNNMTQIKLRTLCKRVQNMINLKDPNRNNHVNLVTKLNVTSDRMKKT